MDRDLELEIVSRLRAGDEAAFDTVHAAFNTRLFSFLVRLSRRRDIAEDLLEETWLRLVAHAGRLRADTRLGPWLFTVARNLHVSYRRSRLLEESHTSGLLGLWPFACPRPSPFEETAATEVERRIESAIEGVRPAEAAAVCGITPEALRQRLSRARALLSRHLDAAGHPNVAILGEVMT